MLYDVGGGDAAVAVVVVEANAAVRLVLLNVAAVEPVAAADVVDVASCAVPDRETRKHYKT